MNIAAAYMNGVALPLNNTKAALYAYAAMQRADAMQRINFTTNINNLARKMSANDMQRAEDLAKSWSPGPGSLSEVLTDAEKMRKPG